MLRPAPQGGAASGGRGARKFRQDSTAPATMAHGRERHGAEGAQG
ncbi:hypothetical protein SSBG_05366 [Streptomyces sp. SPB074]|nr:hypothetical protein SSBG_05366 [Streptomyces sp. SPB074]